MSLADLRNNGRETSVDIHNKEYTFCKNCLEKSQKDGFSHRQAKTNNF